MSFTFLNIPVQIRPVYWISLLFFTDLYQDFSIESVILGFIMFVSILLHEYGHALTAAYFGARPSITLDAFWGKAEYNNYGISRKQEFFITLNGPLFESLLIAISYYLLETGVFDSNYYIYFTLYMTMHVNILWCLLNLIPVEPLDGGHLLRYFLEEKFDDKGYKISLIIGLMMTIVIVPFLYYEGFFFFATLLLTFGFQNFQSLRQNFSRSQVPHFSLLMRGLEAVKINDLEEAKKSFSKLLRSNDKQIQHSAIESLAKIYCDENDSQKSYKLLLKADPQFLSTGKTLLCKLAFERKAYELVAKYSRDIYTLEPTFEIAILNSQAFACLNQPKLAGGWLATAKQFGIQYDDQVNELMKNGIYDSVRDHAVFNETLSFVGS